MKENNFKESFTFFLKTFFTGLKEIFFVYLSYSFPQSFLQGPGTYFRDEIRHGSVFN